jgi:hypothetical protein
LALRPSQSRKISICLTKDIGLCPVLKGCIPWYTGCGMTYPFLKTRILGSVPNETERKCGAAQSLGLQDVNKGVLFREEIHVAYAVYNMNIANTAISSGESSMPRPPLLPSPIPPPLFRFSSLGPGPVFSAGLSASFFPPLSMFGRGS